MRKLSLIHLVILLCLSVFSISTYSTASQKDGLLKVYFFDVGQGDAIWIEAPNGNQVLIDGGPDNSVIQKLGEVMPFYDKDIDIVVSTHSDADHITGLIDVLERLEIRNIVYSNIIRSSSLYDAWREAVDEEGANVVEPVAGKVIDLGSGVTLTIVHPAESLAGRIMPARGGSASGGEKTNNESVVLMLKYGETEVLLTGDIEAKAERQIILSGANLDADILKVAHHGSKTSTLAEFLYEVSPQVAVIQVGTKNRYGHPTQEVLSRLENFGVKLYRTDVDGGVKVISDGVNYLINTVK
ncbi:MAG TPA: ComEC/Rec2 family competence protein [Candidatus Paceibacterota bacterium]|nr:ComEC/Rec2 family competence protein [Candidatus Paceibacterota bacterium]